MSLGVVDNGKPDCDNGSDEEVTLAEGNQFTYINYCVYAASGLRSGQRYLKSKHYGLWIFKYLWNYFSSFREAQDSLWKQHWIVWRKWKLWWNL